MPFPEHSPAPPLSARRTESRFHTDAPHLLLTTQAHAPPAAPDPKVRKAPTHPHSPFTSARAGERCSLSATWLRAQEGKGCRRFAGSYPPPHTVRYAEMQQILFE